MTFPFKPTFARPTLCILGASLLSIALGACASTDPLVSSTPDPAPVGSRTINTPGLSSPGLATPGTEGRGTVGGPSSSFPSGGLGGSGAFRGGR